MDSFDSLAHYIQSFLPQEGDSYYSVFFIENQDKVIMSVVRMPTGATERFYKVDNEIDIDKRTTDSLILLAKMCVREIEVKVSGQ